jgi:hypothetical protein
MLAETEGCELSVDWAQQARNVNGPDMGCCSLQRTVTLQADNAAHKTGTVVREVEIK